MRKIWSWDYGTYLGEIPEAPETYNVVGNVNEHGLIITESTFGGLTLLHGGKSTGTVDYGSLIWITLQRSKNAREAIATMDKLVNTYGYASTGESFSIGDQNELWYMEMIGKGHIEKGAVWVARRVPDGYVSGHANQARITTFPLDDPENTLFSSDVISFARNNDLFSGDDNAFSFSDVYDPMSFSGARMCEARVWSFFSTVMGQEWSDQYLDYVSGTNLTNRMPLWVKPATQLDVAAVMASMRNHYESTALDMSGTEFSDVGAGAYNVPFRASPITWSASEKPHQTFFNERPIATSISGWNIVCESRWWMPPALAAVMWYGADDSSTSVHVPLYGSAAAIPRGFAGPGPQDGVTPPVMTFSLDDSFHLFNMVTNFAYSRWSDVYPPLHEAILRREEDFRNRLAAMDTAAATTLQEQGLDAMVKQITAFGVVIGEEVMKEWLGLFGQLFVRFRDGLNLAKNPMNPMCGCSQDDKGYSNQWYNRIVSDTGNHYQVPRHKHDDTGNNKPVGMTKETMRGVI